MSPSLVPSSDQDHDLHFVLCERFIDHLVGERERIVGDFDAQRPSSASAPLAAPYTESGVTNSSLRRYLQRSKPIRTRGESRMTGVKNTSRTDLVVL